LADASGDRAAVRLIYVKIVPGTRTDEWCRSANTADRSD